MFLLSVSSNSSLTRFGLFQQKAIRCHKKSFLLPTSWRQNPFVQHVTRINIIKALLPAESTSLTYLHTISPSQAFSGYL